MPKRLDDFSPQTKDRLAKRVNYLCSNPECRQPTSGPSSEGDDAVTNIGVAAHITAASPGGPRFDASLTPSQRKGIGNGIWCCQNHGKMVDDDKSTYTVEMLRQWKHDAESEAKNAIEKPNRRRQPNSLEESRLEADRKVLRDIISVLPSNSAALHHLHNHNFDWIFALEWFEDLQKFVYMDGAEHEFLDSELECDRKKLQKSSLEFLNNIAVETCNARTNGWKEIPEEWEDEQPKRFERVLSLLNNGAEQVYVEYQNLIRKGRQRLGV